MGVGDKKKQILQMKKDGEEDNAWKSNRLSVMAAADDGDNNNDILASGDSAALEVEKDGTTKMLSEVLERQTSLEARRDVAQPTLHWLLQGRHMIYLHLSG